MYIFCWLAMASHRWCQLSSNVRPQSMHPLHIAVEHMDEAAVRELLQAGADPNLVENELGGFRPLHVAVDTECEDSCYRYDMGDESASPRATVSRLLVQAGANPDLPDFQGVTARAMAEGRLHHEAIALFGARE